MTTNQFLPYFFIFLLLAICERISNTFFHKKTKSTELIIYKWDFSVLFASYLLIVAFCIGEFFIQKSHVHLPTTLLGLVLYSCGVFLRRRAIFDLGRNWSLYIEIKKEHEFISTGIYRFLKHPYYLAVLCELSGLCLVANAVYALILIILIQMPLLLVRMYNEEKILGSYFDK